MKVAFQIHVKSWALNMGTGQKDSHEKIDKIASTYITH